jgi:NitT/TauT family transport system ATP-binding protein
VSLNVHQGPVDIQPLAGPDVGNNPRGTVLELRNVSKTYPARGNSNSAVLCDINLKASKGEFIALIGPSGCGKTTLLKICAGLIPPTSGAVEYAGTGRSIKPGEYGMVFQSAALLPWRTVLSNVILPAQILKKGNSESKQRAKELVELVRLGHSLDKYPGEMSGGMQQRASIARALMLDPEVLFMDEPFGALDAITRHEMGDELQRVHQNQRKTVLFVTHSIQEAVLLADRVIVLSRPPNYSLKEHIIPLPRPRTFRDSTKKEFRELEEFIHASL